MKFVASLRRRISRDFGLLWFGQSLSELGSGISALAIPIIAIDVLHASAFHVSLVATFESLPYLLFTLPAGAWIDRVAKRSVLIWTDVLRTVAVGSIPVSLFLGTTSIVQLWVVGFVVGTLSVFFNVAYQSYLPTIVGVDELVQGNSRLEVTRSGANVVSPALTGVLLDALGAAKTVILDSVSFIASVVTLSAIRSRETVPHDVTSETRIRDDIREGLRFVWNELRIRQVAFCTGTLNFFGSMAAAIFLVFARRTLELSASTIGLLLALGGIGGMLGALIATRFSGRFGIGRAIVTGAFLSSLGEFTNPILTSRNAPFLIVVGSALVSAGATLYNISQVSMRQAICPPRLQARMNATVRFMVWGTQPLGAITGGLVASHVGLRATLLIAALGSLAGAGLVLAPRIRTIGEMPSPIAS